MKRRDKILLGLVLSILLHLLLLFLGATFSLFEPRQAKKEEPAPIEVKIIPPGERQIADIAPPKEEKRPDDAKFVGLYDSTVPEEKVSTSNIGASGGGGKPKTAPQPPQKEESKKIEKTKEANEEKVKKEKKAEKTKVAMKQPDRFESREFEKSESEHERPGEEDLFQGLSEDFFPNYKIGDRTYLNVLKYPKISYFVRLKKIFRTTWNPISALRASGFNGQISKGNVEVVLGVTIDKNGRLSDLMLIRSSGLRGYDQEALRTIRDSAPFATPPQELLDNSQALRMAWTFTVYL